MDTDKILGKSVRNRTSIAARNGGLQCLAEDAAEVKNCPRIDDNDSGSNFVFCPGTVFFACYASNLYPTGYSNPSEWKAPISPNFLKISRILKGSYLSKFQNEGGSNPSEFWTFMSKVHTFIKNLSFKQFFRLKRGEN